MNLLAQIGLNAPPGIGAAANLTVEGVVSGIISLLLVVAAIVFFFMLLIGGIRWILSGGDKAQTEAARSQITAALVGLVIVFSAWAITNIVSSLFGINIYNLNLPNFVK